MLIYGILSADNLPYEKVGKNEPVCIADEVPFEIPDSWEWVRLSKIVYNRGQMTPTVDFCYIDIGSIDNKNQKLSNEENIITADKAPSRARKIVAIGDILYSTVRPYLHNICIIDRSFSHQAIASTGFAALTCHSGFYNEFLFYYLMSPDFDAYANDTDNAKGVAYPAINDNKLYQALIPVPPEAEQKRIVQKIRKVLPYADRYRTAYSEVESLNNAFPDRLKKSILQEAVQGKLVPQDENDEPASVLLERIRAEKQKLIAEGKIKKDKHESIIFRRDNSHYEKLDGIERCINDEIPFDIPNTWNWVRFSEIALFENGDRSSKYPVETDYVTDGIPFFGAKDMADKYMSFDEVRYISEEKFAQLGNGKLQNGDLICLLRGSVGKTRIFKAVEKYNTGFICAQMLIIRCFNLSILDYVYAAISSPYYTKILETKITGTAVRQLPAKEVAQMLIPLPPLSEQHRIVEKQRELFDKITLI